MAQVVGKINVLSQQDSSKPWKLRMDDGKWYSTGSTDNPGVNQGQTVQFDFTLSKPWRNPQGVEVVFNNITKGTLKAVTDAPKSSAPTSTTSPQNHSTGGTMSKDDYWRNKEARDLENEGKREITQQQIQLQAARNAAIEFVKILAGEKAIVYSTAQTKQTAAARLDTIETLVNHYTAQFLSETQAVGQAAVAEEAQAEAVADGNPEDLG